MNGLEWWMWRRAARRLASWTARWCGGRPFRAEFRRGEGSYCDLSARLIVVEPDLPRGWRRAAALPTSWGEARVTRPRELDVLCARALAAHECAHARYTDTGATRGGAHHMLTNILEDERIERLLAREDARAATDLAELGRRCWEEGCSAAPTRAGRLVGAALYHRWDSKRPAGEPSRLVLRDEGERALWEEEIRPRVEAAWEARDTAGAAARALEILTLLGLDADAGAGALPGVRGGVDGAPRGERAPGDPAETADPSPGGAPAAGDTDPGEFSMHSNDGVAADAPDERVDERSLPSASDAVAPPPATGDGDSPSPRRPRPRSRKRGVPQPAAGDPDLADPLDEAPDLDPSAGVLWMQPFAALEASIAGAAGRLAGELRVRTPESGAAPNNRRGWLDARAAVRTQGKRPLVRRGGEGDSPEGLAVLLLIDGTGSMGGHPGGVDANGSPTDPASFHDPSARMPHVRRAALLLQRACAQAGVPLAVAEGCRSPHRVHLGATRRRHPETSPVAWIQRYTDDPEAEGPRALLAGLYGHAGREAVCAVLDEAGPVLLGRTEGVKLLLYVHDGEPDDRPDAIRDTVWKLRQRGITVLGLYIGPQGERGKLEALFGREWTLGIPEPALLPTLLSRVLARYRRE